MSKFFSDFNGLEMFFVACAVVGGFFVLIKLAQQFVGGGADADVGVDGGVGSDTGHADSDGGFRALSLHGFSAFFMMFGLVGIALYRQSQVEVVTSIVGCSAGSVTDVRCYPWKVVAP